MYLLWFQDCTGIDLSETELTVKLRLTAFKLCSHILRHLHSATMEIDI
jgi:hypothetical protein